MCTVHLNIFTLPVISSQLDRNIQGEMALNVAGRSSLSTTVRYDQDSHRASFTAQVIPRCLCTSPSSEGDKDICNVPQ